MRVDADGDLHLRAPTLRIGSVPVFWLPALWLRTGRKPGLLPPRLEWRGDEGLLGGLDATLPLGDLDLEIGSALRTAGPAEARVHLAGPTAEAEVTARGDDPGGRTEARGGVLATAALAPPELLARVDVASRADLRARAAPDLQAATLRPRPVEAWAHASGSSGGAAMGVEARQTEADGALVLDGAFPSLAAWTPPLVVAPHLFADAHLGAERRLATDLLRASLQPRLVAGAPLGAVRVSAAAIVHVTSARGPALGAATATRIAGGATASATLPVSRPWGHTRHELEPRLAAAWAGLAVDEGPPAGFLQDADAVVPGPRAEVSMASRWSDPSGETPVDLEAGLLATDEVRLLFGEARLATARAHLSATATVDAATGAASSFFDATVGAGPVSLGLGQAHLEEGVPLGSEVRPRVGELPVTGLPEPGAPRPADLGVLRAHLVVGRALELDGRAFTDLDRRTFVAAETTILHHARCGCLTVGLGAAIWEGRRLPEVRAVVRVP